MRAVVILLDSLNRHFLEIYGQNLAQTPALNDLAESSVVFDNHWIGSAPCMPARRDMLTGRLNFLWRHWGPIEPFDVTLPRVLAKEGIFSHMVTDHYHYFEIGGENYHNMFNTWDLIRGQELDPWVSRVNGPSLPGEYYGKAWPQYESNRIKFTSDDTFATPMTFKAAADWLEDNKDADNYLLWVEGFDPHEPFDVPQEFLDLYADDYTGPRFDWGTYGPTKEPREAIDHLRRRYAATITMADKWLGYFLDTMKRLNVFEDTLIILTTDHGHLLGEHGFTGKNIMPAYDELSHIPLLVHLPGGRLAGERVSHLTQNIDLLPTLCDYFGAETPEGVHGYSWMPFLEGGTEVEFPRQAAIYGWFGQSVNITTGKHSYFRAPAGDHNGPLYAYSAMPTTIWRYWPEEAFEKIDAGRFLPFTKMPVFRLPMDGPISPLNNENLLFDLEADPRQSTPIDDGDVEQDLIKLMKTEMERIQSPEEQYQRIGI